MDSNKYIEQLEEENKRLKRENKDTHKITVNFNGFNYEIDTQLKTKFKEGDVVYINNKNQTKLYILGLALKEGIEAIYLIYLCVSYEQYKDLKCYKADYLYVHEKNLFKSKNKAWESYHLLKDKE